MHISTIANVSIFRNQFSELIQFQIEETAPSDVVRLSAEPTDEKLISKIAIGGTRPNYVMIILPAKDLTGVSRITIAAKNQLAEVATTSFDVTVEEPLPLLYLEDSRPLTKAKLEEAGIPVHRTTGGTARMRQYFDILKDFERRSNSCFLLDNDSGADEFKDLLIPQNERGTEGGFTLFASGLCFWIILLPKQFSFEDLFEEFDGHVEECVQSICHPDLRLRESVPTPLSAAAARLRKKQPRDVASAKALIRKHQDVKDQFWLKVNQHNYGLSLTHVQSLKALLRLTSKACA